MRKKKEESLKERTANGLLWGGLNNGVQQLLSLLFGIFLARMLSAEDYGMVGMLTIFTVVASAIQECGFTNALANKQKVSDQDYNAVFWFSTLTGLGLYIILFLCAPLIARFYRHPELSELARFLFFGFVISSTGVAHNAVLFRRLMVREKAVAQMTALAISGLTGIYAAWLEYGYGAIVGQTLMYILVYNVMLWHYSPWRPSLPVSFYPLRDMIGFSSKILVTNVFTQINNNIFALLLGRLFSPAQVGYYTQANKWNNMGHSLITNMVTGVAQPVLTEVADQPGRQLAVFRKMLRFTAFVSFPAMFGLALIAHELVIIAVTDKWAPSVPMLQLLCLWGAIIPLASLGANLIISKGRSDIYMWNTIIIGVLQVAVMWLSSPQGVTAMIASVVILNAVWLFVWHSFVRRLLGLSLLNALADTLPFAFVAAGVMGAVYFLTLPLTNIYVLLLLKVLLAVVLYVGIMWLCRAVVLRDCIGFIRCHLPRHSIHDGR